MNHPRTYTFADLIEHAIGVQGASAAAANQALLREAIQAAYSEVTETRRWKYLLKLFRIPAPATYDTGTIAYDNTTKQVTLTTGTWPSWAASGAIKIGERVHKVVTRTSDSIIVLDSTDGLNPGADISAGAKYRLFQTTYSLPVDFSTLDIPYGEQRWKFGRFTFLRPNEFLSLEQLGDGTGHPFAFTVMADASNPGRMALRTWGGLEAATDLDFLYCRRPRLLVLDGYRTEHKVGSVATTATSATLTGTSTTFDAEMVGSVVRVSRNSTRPSGLEGTNPFSEERVISAYSSATSMTVSSAFANTVSNRAYVISDPLDIEPSMILAIKRCVEKHLAILFNKASKNEAIQLFEAELERASQIDAERSYKPRETGDGSRHRPRASDAVPPDDPE